MKRRRRCLDLTPTEHTHPTGCRDAEVEENGAGQAQEEQQLERRTRPYDSPDASPTLLLELSPGLLILVLPRRFPKRFASSTRSRSETII